MYVHLCQRRQLVTSDERNLKWGTLFFSASLLKLSSLFAHLNCTVRHITHSLTCDTGHVENVKKYVNIGTSFERWHNGVRTLRHSRRPQKDWCINQMLQPKVYSCRICSFSFQVPSEFPIQFTFTRLSWASWIQWNFIFECWNLLKFLAACGNPSHSMSYGWRLNRGVEDIKFGSHCHI